MTEAGRIKASNLQGASQYVCCSLVAIDDVHRRVEDDGPGLDVSNRDHEVGGRQVVDQALCKALLSFHIKGLQRPGGQHGGECHAWDVLPL